MKTRIFQSTPSVGRATAALPWYERKEVISIHALRGEGDDKFLHEQGSAIISIHALRGEGDVSTRKSSASLRIISIHALRGEGDVAGLSSLGLTADFNPRPPWGGRRRRGICRFFRQVISIHALRGEGD